MPLLRFYRRPAATAGALEALIKKVNDATKSADPLARVDSEFVYYVDVAKDGGLSESGEPSFRRLQ